MDNTPLLAREAERRQSALRILDELRLLERWKAYGQPFLVGAVSYGLVVAHDIDLEVYCPGDPRIEDGFDILRACALHPCVRHVSFSNHLHDEDAGFYWQMRYQAEDGPEWKVDMWSVRQDYSLPTSRDLFEPMRRALTDETRAAILCIKEQMASDPSLHCLSIYVYRAVLEGGVRSMPEFREWRMQNPDSGLVAWKPA